MLSKINRCLAGRLAISSVSVICALAVLSLAACVQTSTTNEDQTEATVINKSDIAESDGGVTIYSEEELRRTGRPDAGTALKKLDPRIN
jgi:hypothetical protein